jgi:hypothetical protein
MLENPPFGFLCSFKKSKTENLRFYIEGTLKYFGDINKYLKHCLIFFSRFIHILNSLQDYV